MNGIFRSGLALAAAIWATSCLAQAPLPPGAPPVPAAAPLVVHPLTPSVYWVSGGVGNVGIIVGDQGVVVIDTTISTATAKELLDDIAKITPKPVTTVILTHGDIDHVGGLGAFPDGITVIAQQENRQRLAAAVAAGRSRVPADHLPSRGVIDREAVDLEGVKLELLHWAPAHTAGDLVVYLPAQKIVFTGDIFALDQPRALIHREQQGTSAGWITTAKGITALNADRFVVGHGEVQDRRSLTARVQLVTTEREKIRSLVAKGETLAQIQAEVGDPPPGQSAAGPGGPGAPGGPRFTPFSEVVYQELTEKK